MGMQGNPARSTLWSESQLPRAARLESAARADVAIIGGGFAGLSCARCLKEAEPALDIALLERNHVGYGASGRNAGILSPFLPISWLIDCSATPRRLDDVRFAARYIAGETQALLRLIRREQIACDLMPTRIVTAGANGLYQRHLRFIAERCLLAGIPGHIAAPAELRTMIPYPVHGGFVLEGHALQPLALAQGLQQHVLRLGVRLYENTSVTRLTPARSGIDVLTATGACMKADKVIVATNAYTHQLELGIRRRIPKPITTYLLATAPLDQTSREQLGFRDQTIADIGGEYFYARVWQDRVLFGGFDRPGAAAETTPDQDEPNFRRLREEMTRRFPLLRDVSIDAQWCGPYHETRTRVPILGSLDRAPNVIMNIGYGGVGVTLTQFSGRLVAGLVLGGKHHDPDSDRMREMYATTRFPLAEGIKMGLRLARSMVFTRGDAS